FNRIFLRTLRAIRDLRRYGPSVIAKKGGQLNLAEQQVNLAGAGRDDRRPPRAAWGILFLRPPSRSAPRGGYLGARNRSGTQRTGQAWPVSSGDFLHPFQRVPASQFRRVSQWTPGKALGGHRSSRRAGVPNKK